jgi:glycosyltransferase involved in cell wall biosynthesis
MRGRIETMISIVLPTLGNREKELHRLFDSLQRQTNQQFEVIIVSQDNHEKIDEIISNYSFLFQHVKISKKGLSHARNIGMKYVQGNIVTFSDDDCWYKEDAFEQVIQFFQQNNSSVACFQIYDPIKNEYYKKYPRERKGQLTFKDIFRKSSIEIFINLDSTDKNDIWFDEDFGLGAIYPSGEENLFLSCIYRKGYKISYHPNIVVYHEKPSMESRLNLKTFTSKGPLFKRIFNTPLGLVLLLLLFIRKYQYLDRPFYYLYSAVKEMFKYKKKSNY